jgi:hypothetical protein
MSLQLVGFATVRGIVQKTLVAHVNGVMMTPAMINNTMIAIVNHRISNPISDNLT